MAVTGEQVALSDGREAIEVHAFMSKPGSGGFLVSEATVTAGEGRGIGCLVSTGRGLLAVRSLPQHAAERRLGTPRKG